MILKKMNLRIDKGSCSLYQSGLKNNTPKKLFRITNCTFKKPNISSDMNINYFSATIYEQNDKQQDNKGEKNCTNFMKNYAEKLKKERKRQIKRKNSALKRKYEIQKLERNQFSSTTRHYSQYSQWTNGYQKSIMLQKLEKSHKNKISQMQSYNQQISSPIIDLSEKRICEIIQKMKQCRNKSKNKAQIKLITPLKKIKNQQQKQFKDLEKKKNNHEFRSFQPWQSSYNNIDFSIQNYDK